MRDKTDMLNEIRYAERLCQRTARFYRRVQAVGTFLAIVSGSATLSAVTQAVPGWVAMLGAVGLSLAGAALVAIRPADKAAANEADVRRYSQLRIDAQSMTAPELEAALAKAHTSDAPELEPLREVAYNDVVTEYGRADCVIALRWPQKVFAALA
jgi:hypothetical protein